MPKTRLSGLVLAFATVAFVAGCGEDGPALVSVTGKVTENGAPLADAAVIFAPTSGGAERPGEDVTGPQGNFKLMTNRRSGVAPGKYHVVITRGVPKQSADAAALHPDDPYMANLSTAPPASKKKNTQPSEYTFEREVTAEAKQVIDLDIKSGTPAAAAKSGS